MEVETWCALIGVSAIIIFFSCLMIYQVNTTSLSNCGIVGSSNKVVYEKNLIINTCYVIEDGEELTLNKWMHKHKYDGIEVRE